MLTFHLNSVHTEKHHLTETSVATSVSRKKTGLHLLSKRKIFHRPLCLEKGSVSVNMMWILAHVYLQHTVLRTFLESLFIPFCVTHINCWCLLSDPVLCWTATGAHTVSHWLAYKLLIATVPGFTDISVSELRELNQYDTHVPRMFFHHLLPHQLFPKRALCKHAYCSF